MRTLATLLLVTLLLPLAALAQRDSVIAFADGGSMTLTLPTSVAALAVGEAAPSLTGTDLGGRPASAPAERAVYFFAYADCGLCDEALAQLAAGDFDLKRRARLVYVDLYDDRETLRVHLATAAAAGVDTAAFDVLLADEATFGALPVGRFPTIVTVDRRGRITEMSEGYDEGGVRRLLR